MGLISLPFSNKTVGQEYKSSCSGFKRVPDGDRSMTVYLEKKSGPSEKQEKVMEYLHAKRAVSSPKCEYSKTVFGIE